MTDADLPAFTMDYGHYKVQVVDDNVYLGTQAQADAYATARTEELLPRYRRISVVAVRRVSGRPMCARVIKGGTCAELEGHKSACRPGVVLA